jgi:predicted GIY-YIG superfamily endonuclease
MYYVYILISSVDKSRYVGITKNLKKRFQEHNSGGAKYSSSKIPYILKWYCAFDNKDLAYNFETYLKHGSGHAFVTKHLL